MRTCQKRKKQKREEVGDDKWKGEGKGGGEVRKGFVQTLSVVPVVGTGNGFWLLAQVEADNASEYPHSTQDSPSK